MISSTAGTNKIFMPVICNTWLKSTAFIITKLQYIHNCSVCQYSSSGEQGIKHMDIACS